MPVPRLQDLERIVYKPHTGLLPACADTVREPSLAGRSRNLPPRNPVTAAARDDDRVEAVYGPTGIEHNLQGNRVAASAADLSGESGGFEPPSRKCRRLERHLQRDIRRIGQHQICPEAPDRLLPTDRRDDLQPLLPGQLPDRNPAPFVHGIQRNHTAIDRNIADSNLAPADIDNQEMVELAHRDTPHARISPHRGQVVVGPTMFVRMIIAVRVAAEHRDVAAGKKQLFDPPIIGVAVRKPQRRVHDDKDRTFARRLRKYGGEIVRLPVGNPDPPVVEQFFAVEHQEQGVPDPKTVVAPAETLLPDPGQFPVAVVVVSRNIEEGHAEPAAQRQELVPLPVGMRTVGRVSVDQVPDRNDEVGTVFADALQSPAENLRAFPSGPVSRYGKAEIPGHGRRSGKRPGSRSPVIKELGSGRERYQQAEKKQSLHDPRRLIDQQPERGMNIPCMEHVEAFVTGLSDRALRKDLRTSMRLERDGFGHLPPLLEDKLEFDIGGILEYIAITAVRPAGLLTPDRSPEDRLQPALGTVEEIVVVSDRPNRASLTPSSVCSRAKTRVTGRWLFTRSNS